MQRGGKRLGSGRPVGTTGPNKPEEELKKNRSIKFTDNEWEAIRKKAHDSGFKNASEYIRQKTLKD